MLKIVAVIFTTIITSLYFFPFEFTFLPGVNTKMMLAALGLVLLASDLAKGHKGNINKDFFTLSLYAILVSFAGLLAITINNTMDTTYATYIISMWVWCGGAYSVIWLIKAVHGKVSIELVAHYLIAVCISQCAVAMFMDQYPPLKQFVDGFLGSEGYMGKIENRIYGIGASLDVAGMRFAAVLILIAYLMLNASNMSNGRMLLYVMAFIVIIVLGNMIGRTTMLGAIFSIGYWVMKMFSRQDKSNMKRLGWLLCGCICVFVPIIVLLYNTNMSFHNNIRFAFEGFFNLFEKGKWETSSTNMLKNMYVFPETMKTWLIGDGYFDNPYNYDPYYQGPQFHGFYMATDVGYLRFIFYFGLFGLLSFFFYMYKVANTCWNRFAAHKKLFIFLLLLNYAVWFKVSSDLFSLFALFLCINEEERENETMTVMH